MWVDPSGYACKKINGVDVVHLDNNALVEAIDNGNAARVDAAINGRIPVISDAVIDEYLASPKANQDDLLDFLIKRGGDFAGSASDADIQALIALGPTAKQPRVIHKADAAVAATAIRDDAYLLTADSRLTKYLKEFGYKVEGF